MPHLGIPGLVNALNNAVEVSTVWYTTDHYLSTFGDIVKVVVKGRLNPTHWEIIQAQKGMLVLDSRCGICTCISDDDGNDIVPGSVQAGYQTFFFTTIQEAAEKRNTREWVKKLQDAFNAVSFKDQ